MWRLPWMINGEVVTASVETVGAMVSVSILVPVARSADAVTVSMFAVPVLTSGMGGFMVATAAEVIFEFPVVSSVMLVKDVLAVVTTVVDTTLAMPVAVAVAAAAVFRIVTVWMFATVELIVVLARDGANVELVSGLICVDAEDVTEMIHALWRRSRDC